MVTDKNEDDRRVERIRILTISSKILMKNRIHLRLFLNRKWVIRAIRGFFVIEIGLHGKLTAEPRNCDSLFESRENPARLSRNPMENHGDTEATEKTKEKLIKSTDRTQMKHGFFGDWFSIVLWTRGLDFQFRCGHGNNCIKAGTLIRTHLR